jgi:aspartate aminotransferase
MGPQKTNRSSPMAFLSDTLARVKPSPTIAVTTKAAQLKA